jgi:two-component system chemotaxis sensor kinase CheA
MDDLLRDFLTESAENLARLDREIVALERAPGDLMLLGSIFRTIHTIKGTCGFLDLHRLEKVAHAAENVLDRLRDGSLGVTPIIISDVLAAVDVIKLILEGLEQTESEPQGDDSALIARLARWTGDDPGDETEISFEALAAEIAAPVVEAAAPSLVAVPAIVAADVAPAASSGTAPAAASVAESSLRVPVEVLDLLMNLAGELVLTRNQLVQVGDEDESFALRLPLQNLSRVTSELQEAVMRTRMQPVGNAWGKLPRLVRDLCQASGKQIDLELNGAETELDRQVLQAIGDPLTHMVRNSADHGIEMPEVRRAAGKPERGTIRLNAFHEGGHIVIDVSDDGRGLDASAIRAKAVERGLVRADQAATLSDAQVFRFIFEAGFSTAAAVTNVSGRGVGMDVVRSNLEKIGGSVELSSTLGAGTTVRVKIPLTLAILSALIVGSGGQCFAVPQIGVTELVRIDESNAQLRETINGVHFFRLRDTLLPLVPLAAVLQTESGAGAGGSIVVCQVGAHRFGLLVDEIFDTHEIVVKPVGRMVKHLPVYAGTTILGDGRVVMILDVPGIAQVSRVMEQEATDTASAEAAEGAAEAGRTALIVFDTGGGVRQAVPLERVSRLEKIPAADIEVADGRWLVQYRGALLPLIPARDGMDPRALDPRPTIVFSDGARSLGLAVDEIHDIVEDYLAIEMDAAREGLLGTAVVGGKSAEVLDLDYFFDDARAPRPRPQDPLPVLREFLGQFDRATLLEALQSLLTPDPEAR